VRVEATEEFLIRGPRKAKIERKDSVHHDPSILHEQGLGLGRGPAEDGQRNHAVLLEGGDQRVNVGQVPILEVSVIEKHSHDRSVRGFRFRAAIPIEVVSQLDERPGRLGMIDADSNRGLGRLDRDSLSSAQAHIEKSEAARDVLCATVCPILDGGGQQRFILLDAGLASRWFGPVSQDSGAASHRPAEPGRKTRGSLAWHQVREDDVGLFPAFRRRLEVAINQVDPVRSPTLDKPFLGLGHHLGEASKYGDAQRLLGRGQRRPDGQKRKRLHRRIRSPASAMRPGTG
jgi:hypothetical protein